MTIRIEIRNLDEVKRLIAELGPRAKTVLPQAVEEGAKVLQAKMISLAPGPGIGIEMNGATAYIGPDKQHFYYAFFETGTSAHRVSPVRKQALNWGGDAFSAGHTVGGIAPEPFMRPAVDEGADAVGQRVGEVIAQALD